jgi:hypothetical protein
MSKKDQHFAAAEEMFVARLMNVADIAEKLGLAEKTIRNWKAEGDWDRKRREAMYDGASIEESQRKIGVRVAELINTMLDEGEVPPRHLFSYLLGVGSGMQKARAYEESMPPADDPAAKKGPSVERMKQIMQELGLT